MAAIARLGAVSLDGDDPKSLAEFWRELLELDIMFESEDFVALKGAGVLITTQRVASHQPPDWPEATVPKQIHLELAVTDLDAVEKRAVGQRHGDDDHGPPLAASSTASTTWAGSSSSTSTTASATSA